MLRIHAVTFNKQPMMQPVAADFDESGGSIGRATENTLVLPDEKRYISRTQASIVFRAGSYFLRDHGSASPTLVNGTAIGSENEILLKQGDEITIGEYSLGVSIVSNPAVEKVAAAPPGAAADKVARALVAGLGIRELQGSGRLTPEVAGLVAEILREAIRGTLDLLVTRALMKRDVRARATVIVPKENNPLKVSPNVETALAHLLGRERPGFLPPLAAVRDAYNDLRAHQLATMAGMQAALDRVLAHFDLKDVEDDVHKLFNEEFVRGYEAEIERLKQEISEKP